MGVTISLYSDTYSEQNIRLSYLSQINLPNYLIVCKTGYRLALMQELLKKGCGR